MTWVGLIFACQVIFLGILSVHFNWHFSSSLIVTFLKMEIHSTWKLSLTFCITTLPSSKYCRFVFFLLLFISFLQVLFVTNSPSPYMESLLTYSMYFCLLTRFSGMIENRKVLSVLCGILKQYFISGNML